MVSFGIYQGNRIYKGNSWSGTAIGGVHQGDKIYKGNSWSGTAIGGVHQGDKIFKGNSWSGTAIGSAASIKREIKDSNSVDGATVVAAYHFLIKSIF